MTTTSPVILIGEDERALAKAMQLKLEKEGFTVVLAYNGEEVIQAVTGKQFDLLLLDMIMPKMDGFAVLEKLQEMKVTMPVIVTSNLGQPEDIARAKKLGAKDYLIKSNTPLVKIVEYIKAQLA